jgi:hypothetical protein
MYGLREQCRQPNQPPLYVSKRKYNGDHENSAKRG